MTWEKIELDKWPAFRCRKCGTVVEIRTGNVEEALAGLGDCDRHKPELPTDVPEPETEHKPQSSPAKAWRYAKALNRWRKAGRPKRSQAKINRIFAICQECRWFDPERRTCRCCGCRVRRDGRAFLNKLAMKTEGCGDMPPKWTAEVEVPG